MQMQFGKLVAREPMPGVVWAFAFDADGAPTQLGPGDPLAADAPLIWAHVNLVDQRACRWLGAHAALPQEARDFLLARQPAQFASAEGGLLMLAVADFTREAHAVEAMRLGVLQMVVTERFVLTARHVPLRATDAAGTRAERGQLRARNAAELVGRFLDEQIATAAGLVDELDRTVQSVEDRLMVRDKADSKELVGLRRRLVQLHRLLRGARATFHRLEREPPGDLAPAFAELAARLTQRYEALDADVVTLQDQTRLLQEELDTAAAEESSKSLTLLSGMTALFLPPTLITSFFGMNTGGLPWAGGHGTTLAGVVVLLSIYVTYRLLKRRGFF